MKNLKALVGIAAIVGASCISCVTLVGVFSPQQIGVAGWIAGFLCLMGAALGNLAAKSYEN